MSFTLYLQVFHNREAAGISLQTIRDAFAGSLTELEEDFWQVQFGSDQSSDLFLQPLAGDAGLIHTVSIHRPCTDARLYDGLWSLLAVPGAVLYFPDCVAPLTRDRDAGLAMPIDMLESLGEPVIVRSAQEIPQAIDGA